MSLTDSCVKRRGEAPRPKAHTSLVVLHHASKHRTGDLGLGKDWRNTKMRDILSKKQFVEHSANKQGIWAIRVWATTCQRGDAHWRGRWETAVTSHFFSVIYGRGHCPVHEE